MKKISILLAAILILGTFSGCSVGRNVVNKSIDESSFVDFSKYNDSEDIPDWTGEDLGLVKWVQATNPNATVGRSEALGNDPISKEIKRITGISYDIENSFDNAGSSFDAVIAKLIATDSFPHVAEGLPDLTSLVKNNYLWDISKYIEKYAPTVYTLFGPNSNTLYGDQWKRQIKDYGGVFALSVGAVNYGLRDMVAKDGSYDLTDEQLDNLLGVGNSAYPYFYMRDDILKKLFPQAHTVSELEEIYAKKGEFTKEEILDVPLESPDDFVDMLYKIKGMGLKDGNAEVHAMFTHAGMDNWPVLCQLGTMFRYHTSPASSNVNYFSYYDMKEHTIKPTFKQEWFKDILKMHNKFIRDGVASEEALVDTYSIFKEKLNNGRYIIGYGSYFPTKAELNGKYAYRKVYARYKIKMDDYLFNAVDYSNSGRLSFFKKSVSESQLIQIIRMLEFMASNAGQKLHFWGTKSMGLYTQTEDGFLQYVDETIKNQMLNPNAHGHDQTAKHGLYNAWPIRIAVSASKYAPLLYYAKEAASWETAFNAAHIERHILTPSMPPNIYAVSVLEKFPEAQAFWNARKGFEDALLKVFAARSDDEFEMLYKTMVDYAESYGLTNQLYEEFTKYYKEVYNREYMDYILKK